MPRSASNVVENNFSKGLITEGSPMSFPDNACTTSENCVHHPDGSIFRRYGFEFETNYETTPVSRNSAYISEYIWKTAGGLVDYTFLVVQHGITLRFFRLTSAGKLGSYQATYDIDLTDFLPIGSTYNPKDARCQYASGNGYLFVSHRYLNPFYVEFAPGDGMTTHTIGVKTRDFEGVDDGLEFDERPLTLTNPHKYNLFNQGWYRSSVLVDVNGNNSANPITTFHTSINVYPSNAEQWWFYKRSDNSFGPGEVHDAVAYGNTPAPKGHFIFNTFSQDRNNLISEITGLGSVDSGDIRPRTIAFFAGRVWYSGVNYKTFTGKVYFSQVIEDDDQIGRCYQLNDPTSENNADLLPTDGGVAVIQDAGNIIKLIPLGASLYVFATNGIWSIGGSSGTGFSANDYSVQKVSGVGCLTETSFVDIGSAILWWNSDGIYGLKLSEIGTAGVESLSDKTIKTYFKDIPTSSVLNAKGAYNPLTQIVQWVFRYSSAEDVDTQQDCNRVLNFDTSTGAFYPWTMSIVDPRINGIVATDNPRSTEQGATQFYYLVTIRPELGGTIWDFTLAFNKDETYKDWTIATDGITYNSQFITGYKLYGDGNKSFQSNYLTLYLDNNDEDSSVFIQGVWDFSKIADEFRWSVAQQGYLFADRNAYGTVFRKLKIRGHGKALQIRCVSEDNYPFRLLGWSMVISGNTGV